MARLPPPHSVPLSAWMGRVGAQDKGSCQGVTWSHSLGWQAHSPPPLTTHHRVHPRTTGPSPAPPASPGSPEARISAHRAGCPRGRGGAGRQGGRRGLTWLGRLRASARTASGADGAQGPLRRSSSSALTVRSTPSSARLPWRLVHGGNSRTFAGGRNERARSMSAVASARAFPSGRRHALGLG